MRLTNTLAIFQQIINQVLYYKLDYTIIVYLNNILIYTIETKEEHKKKTQKVLQLLQNQNI